MKKLFIISLIILISINCVAQYGYRDANRIGISIGVNQFNLNTYNFDTTAQTGWNAGLSVRGNYYDNWDMTYNIQFSENNFSVISENMVFGKEKVNFNLSSAQISLQLSYVLIENLLSFEFGPLLQVSGKFQINPNQENNSISGTTLAAKDILEISRFHFYPIIGLTTGLKHFRINVCYQYGFQT